MTNPIDNDTLKVYLKFKSLGNDDLYQIVTPTGFKESYYEKKQEDKRHARDVEFFAIDKIRFELCEGKRLDAPRVINERGDTCEYMDMGIDWILYIKNRFGVNSEIELYISQNGIFFPYLELDFNEIEQTDDETFLECKLIQSGKAGEIKRKLDSKFNVFDTKNYKDDVITPAPVTKILRRGTSKKRQSKWKCEEATVIETKVSFVGSGDRYYYWNPCVRIEKSDIKNTLVGLIDLINNPSNEREDLRYLRAKTELTNVSVKISNLVWEQDADTLPGQGDGYVVNKLILAWGFSVDDPIGYTELVTTTNGTLEDGESETFTVNNTYNIPYIPAGAYLYFFFESFVRKSNSGGGGMLCVHNISLFDLEVNVTSNPLSVVIPTVRYIDLIKQSLKSINGLPVQSKLYDIGGDEYNNVVYNKNMIAGKTDLFLTAPKDVYSQLIETNSDIELNNDFAFIGQEDEFYENVEIGYFEEAVSKEYRTAFNPKFAVNKLKVEYKEFAQEKTLENTNTTIHGRSEWNIVNPKCDGYKEITIPYIRDYNKIQEIVDQVFFIPETSTTEDSSVIMEKITPLPPSYFESWSALLSFRIVNGNLEVLNRDSNGEANDFIVNWNLIGVQVGSQFEITFGQNVGVYTVNSITVNVLTLFGGSPSYEGDAGVTVKYYPIGVKFTNQTNENFIGLVDDENTYSNLEVSLKRILIKYYSKYLANALTFSPLDKITNVEYYPNKDFVSQKVTEANPIAESAPIFKADLQTPNITNDIDTFYLGADYGDVVNMLNLYKTKKGFIRVNRGDKVFKGFIKSFKYNPQTQELDADLERKYEPINLVLTITNDGLLVNDALYQSIGIYKWWEFRNDEFRVFDEKMRPISNFYNFNLVILNGVSYNTKQLLIEALENL